MRGSSLRTLSLLAIAALLMTACPPSRDSDPGPGPSQLDRDPSYSVHFFGDPSDPVVAGMLQGAQLAASTIPAATLGRPVVIVEHGALDPVALAGLVDDPDAVGALVTGNTALLDKAEPALTSGRLPVFALTEDIYETAGVRPWTFAGAIPHGWQSWRLARYFGPGDRAYRKVGLIASSDIDGEAARTTLAHELARRGVQFVDAGPLTGPEWPELTERLSALRSARVDAVVVEGPRSLLTATASALGSPEQTYKGRSSIHDGWRPQVAGYSSLLQSGMDLPPGSVAVSDFTHAVRSGIERVEAFIEAFQQKYRSEPIGFESIAYDAVRSMVEAFRRAELDRARTVEQAETFDRVTFARTQISFAAFDHVLAERDVLGLWAVTKDSHWSILHRTFTNDLERTNIHEEDWQVFFPQSVPGGEAPFYKDAIWGITSDTGDDLH